MGDNKITNCKDQQQRLLQVIKENYESIGGHIENEVLYVEDQAIPLAPLLNIFKRILNSQEFTRLPPLFDATENLPIADMYVELVVAKSLGISDPLRLSHGLSQADEQEARHKQGMARHNSIEQCVANKQHHNIVILGDPGSGKTSLLKYLCLQVAKGKNKRWLYPVFISLRQYWIEKEKCPSLTILNYAVASLVGQKNKRNIFPDFSLIMHDEANAYKNQRDEIKELEGILSCISSTDHKHVLFLLDGLNEIASNSEATEIVSEEIRQLGQGFSWILTSRYTGFYSGIGEDIRYEIVSLHQQGIEDLVTNWFKHTHQTKSLEKTQLMLKQIQSNPRLYDMARNPFLLTLLCYVHNYNQQQIFPLQSNDIYAEILKLVRLQLRFIKRNDQLFRKTEMDYLSRFCYYLYTKAENAPLQLFGYDHWDAFAATDTPPDMKKHLLSSRLLNSWKQQGHFHFVHLSFQEYFIALYLSQKKPDHVKEQLFNPQWRMVYRFLAGIYAKKQEKKTMLI